MITLKDIEKILEQAWSKGIIGRQDKDGGIDMYFDEEVFQKEAAKTLFHILEEKDREIVSLAEKLEFWRTTSEESDYALGERIKEIAALKAENQRLKAELDASHIDYDFVLPPPGKVIGKIAGTFVPNDSRQQPLPEQ